MPDMCGRYQILVALAKQICPPTVSTNTAGRLLRHAEFRPASISRCSDFDPVTGGGNKNDTSEVLYL
jgi:hypothetical protein